MAVQIQIREETVQACLSGEIDHHSAAQMREKIDESVIQSGAKTLVLDFSLVTFMDSSGIGLVMGRFRLMQENGGELVLQNLPAPLRKVMKLDGGRVLMQAFDREFSSVTAPAKDVQVMGQCVRLQRSL